MRRAALAIFMSAAACASPPPLSALGITLQAADAGVIIVEVRADTPAAVAGLQAGDLLLRYNGVWVTDARQARALMLDSAPGSTVEVELLREGKVERIFIPVQ